MGSAEPELEDIFGQKERHRSPLVPIGALITAGILTAGIINFKRGGSPQTSQKLMRARVVAQGVTVAVMVGTAFYYGEDPWGKKKE